jgi:hypothetical protein
MHGEGGSYIEQEDGSLMLVSRTQPAQLKSQAAASEVPVTVTVVAGKPVIQAKPKKGTAE